MTQFIKKMAYVNHAPWHGLGSKLTVDQPVEVWQRESGMDWTIRESQVLFNFSEENDSGTISYPDQKVLFRSDSLRPLSVVSQRYQVVQPYEVLEF